MADTAVVSQIQHYQKSIEKYADNEARVLHCIEKLYRLPVTVQHLQETGVGRTINALRKFDGTVGDASKALVAKWKSMVADEESSDCDDENESCMPDVPEKYSDNSNSPVNKSSSSSSRHKSHKHRDEGSHNSSKHNSSKQSSSQSSSDNCKSRLSVTTINSENSVNISKSSDSSEKNSGSKDKKIKSKSDKHDVKKNEKSSGSHSTSMKSCNGKNESSNKNSSTTEFQEMNGNYSHRKRTRENSSSETVTSKRRKGTEGSNDENDEKLSDTSRYENNTQSSNSPSINCASTSQKAIKIEKSDEKITESKYKSEHNKSFNGRDHVKNEKKKNHEKDSSKSHSNSKSRDSESSKKDKDKKSESSKDKHKSQSKKHKSKYRKDESIDCNSGTSFADALGMCTGPIIRTKKNPSSPVSSGTKIKSSEPKTVYNTNKIDKVKTEPRSPAKENQEELSLLAPNVKLEPLSVDIASTLPEISTNYKPLPTNFMNPIHRKLEEDRALSDVMYAKNLRTKVYSGVKTSYTSVPSLQDLCIRVLIDNIDALEATGGVPYYIIKPVLERATPDQLFTIEHYNPYLIEDTDALWQFHCNREFRSKQREEMESWRDMYLRCFDEREAKLKLLTANIRQSQDKSLPVRVTKLAYVDNVVKPPRNILKKQAKYGTANASSSSDIKKKLLIGGSNAATNISVPPPPMGRSKSSGSGIVKKNKAPLMAKALQLIKGRYKR